MPESDNPAISVGRYGGIFSIAAEALPWWHWRALATNLRHPVTAWRAWRQRRAEPKPSFTAYLADGVAARLNADYGALPRPFEVDSIERFDAVFGRASLADDAAARATLAQFFAEVPRLDPALVPRADLLREDFAAHARPVLYGSDFETTHLRRPSKGTLSETLAGLRATRTPSLPAHSCCGGPKALGHEPGCQVDIERRARSGRYDD